MRIWRTVAELLLVLIALSAVAQEAEFNWNWRDQEVIGQHDASVGNTSKLTEPERAALLDAIVLRLQKPMTDAGYDDDRIREIASTTRIRFVDFGGGKPLLFATSLGMEGGCDPLGNCPLWVFRRSSGGFVSLLDAVAASYTLQSSDGDLVLMHHVSPRQSGLEVYRLDDGKLNQGGCYTAKWPAPSDDPAQVSGPEIVPCKEGTAEPAPLTPGAKPEITPSPTGEAKPDTSEQKQEAGQATPTESQAKPDAPEAKPDTPPSPEVKQPLPDASRAGEAKPDTPDQKQPAPDAPTEPQAKADTPDAKPDAPPADSKPPAPDAQPQPDTKPSSPDAPPPPDSKPAPDAPPPGEAKPDSQAQKEQPAPEQASPDSKPEAPQTPPDQPQAPPPRSN